MSLRGNFLSDIMIAVLKYLEWGMSVIEIANSQLITFTLQIFTQVIVAYLSDKYVSKYGRRKPFVFVGYVLRYVAFIFLAIPPNHDGNILFSWYTFFFSIVGIGSAISGNTFTSWMIESSVDDEDYIRLNSICLPLGGIFGSIAGLLLVMMSPLLCAFICLIGGMITLLIMLYYVPGKVFREAKKLPNMIPSLRICFQTQEFRKVFMSSIFFHAAATIFATMTFLLLFLGFHRHNQSFVITCSLYDGIIAGLFGTLIIVACNWILTYVDKMKFYAILLSGIFFLSIGLFFTTFSPSAFYIYLFFVGLIGFLGVPAGMLITLFLRDLVVYDTFATCKCVFAGFMIR